MSSSPIRTDATIAAQRLQRRAERARVEAVRAARRRLEATATARDARPHRASTHA